MRASRKAHVVSLSLKARSAIMLGGHGGDAVTWLTDTLDSWETVAGYSEKGVPAVKAFVDANPITADFGKTWEKSLPAASYSGPDDGVGEAPPPGMDAQLPARAERHLRAEPTAPTSRSGSAVRSPTRISDASPRRWSQSLQLGKHDGTDVLAVSFSSPDLVGHAFGPRSHEIQDMYMHLDQTIGTLFDQLDAAVGKDQWVVALTADHGVTPIPEQLDRRGQGRRPDQRRRDGRRDRAGAAGRRSATRGTSRC